MKEIKTELCQSWLSNLWFKSWNHPSLHSHTHLPS